MILCCKGIQCVFYVFTFIMGSRGVNQETCERDIERIERYSKLSQYQRNYDYTQSGNGRKSFGVAL